MSSCDETKEIETEVLPTKTVLLVNTCEAVSLDVDDATQNVRSGYIMEEIVTVGLVTGPMKRCAIFFHQAIQPIVVYVVFVEASTKP